MATELPAIRAQAELDLSLFRQQEAQFRAALAGIGQAMQRLPDVRLAVSTEALQRATQAGSQAAGKMAADIEREAKRASDALTREGQKAQTALERAYKQQADAAIRESNRVARAESQDFDRRLRDRERLRQEEERISKQATTVAGGVGVGLGAAGAAIGAQLIEAGKAAAEFEKAFSQVRAVLSPRELAESGAQLEALARSLGQQGLGFTATQAAAALEEMAKAGISAREQLAAAPSVMALAAAGAVSVGEAAAFAANAMTVFGLSGQDIPRIVDQISGAAVATTADVRDLQIAFSQFGAVAKLSGQSVEDTVTSIALLAQAGIKGSDAGTSLRTMFLRLQPATAEAAATMRQYGIIQGQTNRLLNDSQTGFRTAAEIAEVLKDTLGRLGEAQRQAALETIFGSDAIRAAAIFTKQGADGWRALTTAMGETTAIGVASKRLDNLAGDVQKAQSAWNNLQIAFGLQIEPNLRPITQQFTALAQAATNLSPEVQKTLLVLAGGVATFAAVTGAVLAFQAAVALAGVGLAALGVAIAPVAIPVAALTAAAILLGTAWVNNLGGMQETTTRAVARMTTDLAGLAALAGRVTAAFTDTAAAVGRLGQAAGGALGIDAGALAAAGQAAGVAVGNAFKAGLLLALGPAGLALLGIEQFIHAEGERAAAAAAEEGKRIGGDFVGNVVTAIIASTDAQSDAASAAFQQLTNEFLGRGFDLPTAQAAATQYMEQVIAALAAKRAALAAEGAAQAEAMASGLAQSTAPADAVTRAFQALTKAKNDLNEALGWAGTDQEAIAALLEIKAATEGTGASVDQLVDRSIAAAVIALRNQANEAQDAATKIGLLREAQELLSSHLSAQAESARQLGRAQGNAADQARQQAEAERQLGEAIRNVPIADFNARVGQLVGAVMPQLSQETANLINVKLAEGQAWQAAQIAAAAFGATAEQVNTILTGTGAQAAEVVSQLQRIAAASDVAGNALKIQEAAAGDMLQTLTRGLPASEQAWFQYVAAVQGNAAALRQVYERMGGDLAAFDRASAQRQQNMVNRLAQAQEAARTLREEGRLLPAPQLPDLTRQHTEQLETLNRTARRAAEDLAVQQRRLREDSARTAGEAFQQSARNEAQFQQARQDVLNGLQESLGQIASARAGAFAQFNRDAQREAEDFQRQWERQQRDFAQADAESIRGLRAQAGDLLVGAASEFHTAAAQAIDGLLGLSGGALQQAAASVVDRFAGVSDAARDASAQITDAQQAMLDRVRETFQNVNRQAADSARQIRAQLEGAAVSAVNLLSGVFVNLPGQGSPEQQTALQATEARNRAILEANLKIAEQARQQQSILTDAQRARDEADQAAQAAQADLDKQMVDLAKQAREQRAQMVVQLTRMVEGFQRGAFQTVQQRADQREDTGIARDRAAEALTRALEQQLTALNRQAQQAQQEAAERLRQLERQRAEQREAERQAELARERAERRQQEDIARAERRRQEDEARERQRIAREERQAREFARMREALEALRDRLGTGPDVTLDVHDSVFVEPAVEFLEIALERLRDVATAGA